MNGRDELDEGALRARARRLSEEGARAPDALLVAWRCVPCGRPLPEEEPRDVGSVPYRDLVSLRQWAAECVARLLALAPACAGCGGQLRLVAAEYRAGVPTLGRDLVVAARPLPGGGAETRLLWWTPDGGAEACEGLASAEEVAFAHDLLLRRAHLAAAAADVPGLLEALERSLAEYAGDAALLDFVGALLARGRAGLAGAIAEAHVERHPDDWRGHFLHAEVVLQAVHHGALPRGELGGAERGLRRALRLRPDAADVQVSLANLLRLRGEEGEARRLLGAVLAASPGRADVHFNLAALHLEREPEVALEHFRRGEALDPGDPDYPAGAARALRRLGRADEARAALRRARSLAPADEGLARLEGEIG